MTTTPADLLAAAEYFTSRQSCECDHEVGITNCIGCDIDRMARHILATVHTDDDEPVTVAWLREMGHPVQDDKANNCVRVFLHNTGSQFVYADRFNGIWSVMIGTICLVVDPTRGQLRHLLAGLGMGGAKCR